MEKCHEKQKAFHIAFVGPENTNRVRTTDGTTDNFAVGVGLSQGSSLNQFLFNIVFDMLTKKLRENPHLCFQYADDVVTMTSSRMALQENLKAWRQALETRNMEISRSKTEYMSRNMDGDQQLIIQLDESGLRRATIFKYLGSVAQSSGDLYSR